MRPLVILRPEPGASATARAAKEAGLTPLVVPLFRIDALTWQAPDAARFDALLLTSANAPRRAGPELERLRDLPVHCVGERTAEAARDAGLAIASVGPAGVDALLESLPAELKLLHLSGADRREPSVRGPSIEAVAVYTAVELPRPRQLEDVEGAVFAVHSQRAASVLTRHFDEAGLDRSAAAVAAISSESAAAAGNGWQAVEVAPQATDTALLAIAARLCNNCG